MKKLSFMVAAILVFASAPKVLMAAPAVMAEQAATEDVVDYTFDWTQQSAYNMWAPDEVKKNISVSDEDGLSVKNETAKNFWDIQYVIGSNVSLKKGTDYSIKITMKGSADGHATVAMGTWDNFGTPGTVTFTDQYATYTLPYTSVYEGTDGFILMQSGDFVGTISVKSIQVVHSEKATTRYTLDLANVDYTAHNATPAGGWGNGFKSEIVDGACVINHEVTPDPWNVQVNFGNVYPKGAIINLSMEVKGSEEGSISAGLQNSNGYKDCGNFPAINLTKDYKKVAVSTVCSGDGADRLLLNLGTYAGTVSIKNLKIVAEEVKQETVTISPSGYSTYAAYYPVDYSKLGLEAYAVKLNAEEKTITLKKIEEGVVPAGKAVLLKGTPGKSYELKIGEGDEAKFDTDLKVSDGTATSSEKTAVAVYGLATVDGQDGFYKASKGKTIPVKCAYLEVANSAASSVKCFSLGDHSGSTTGITSVKNEAAGNNAPMYNLAGQLVDKGYKGIVIKNGKKIVLK